jgi:hypothetical protein
MNPYCAAKEDKTMLHRRASIFLIVLCVAALPLGNTAVAKATVSPRNQNPAPLEPIDDGNPNTNEFHGGYWTRGQYVGLDAYSVKSDPYYVPTADGRWEERVDYLYTDSDMNKSDGSPLSYSVRELNRYAGQDMLYMTLGSVTLTFNLNTEEVGPVSDADLAWLNAWVVSADGLLVQDTSISLIQYGDTQTLAEPLLNYYFVAMAVDTNPPSESASKILDKRGKTARVSPALFTPARAATATPVFRNPCWSPTDSLASNNSLLAPVVARMPVQCMGCCGAGCYCIRNRYGYVIAGGPCTTHDSCTRSSGSPFARSCLGSLARSIIYVGARYWTF